MKDGYLKIHNTDPKEFRTRYEDSLIIVPANSAIVVSQVVGEYLQALYAHLEIVPSTLEAYQAYRIERETLDVREHEENQIVLSNANQAQIEAEEASKVSEQAKADLVAKQVADKLVHEENMKQEEALRLAQVDSTMARIVGTGSLPPTHITDGMMEADAKKKTPNS